MRRYGVMGIPTLILFAAGREAARLIGLQPAAAIRRMIRDALAAEAKSDTTGEAAGG
jgi:thioredoxin-like negative regulator of GroEL